MLKKNQLGFTLIELMIVIAIIGILGIVAYPSYTKQILKSRRVDAHSSLMTYAMKFEEFYGNNYTYTGAPAAYGLGTSANTANNYYRITATGSGDTYTLTATAQGSQAKDTACTPITLDQTGNKLPAGCW